MINSSDSPVVVMINNRPETLFNFEDFLFYVEKNMGHEAVEYLKDYCFIHGGESFEQKFYEVYEEYKRILDDYEDLERTNRSLQKTNSEMKEILKEIKGLSSKLCLMKLN